MRLASLSSMSGSPCNLKWAMSDQPSGRGTTGIAMPKLQKRGSHPQNRKIKNVSISFRRPPRTAVATPKVCIKDQALALHSWWGSLGHLCCGTQNEIPESLNMGETQVKDSRLLVFKLGPLLVYFSSSCIYFLLFSLAFFTKCWAESRMHCLSLPTKAMR